MSLTQAFNDVNINAGHWATESGSYIGELMIEALKANKPLFYFLPQYEAFTQMDVCNLDRGLCIFPQVHLFELLYRQYPDSMFILNYRNIDDHIRNICNWGNLKNRMCHFGIENLEEFISDHYRNIRRFFAGKQNFVEFDIDDKNKDAILSGFLKIKIHLPHINVGV
jgi:hypothetical protein